MSHHLIRRQYLHVQMNGTESEGLALQRSLPGLCQYWLTPAIERVLERCAPQDGHWCIERLELDVGALTLEGLERDLAEAVEQILEITLREQISAGGSTAPIISGSIRHRTGQQTINEAFIYFLETGNLPWSFRLPAGSTLEQVILAFWLEAAQSGLSPLAGEDAVFRTLADAAARQRLIRQFSPVFLETLLTLLSPPGAKIMGTALQTLDQTGAPPAAKNDFARQLWEAAFAKVATGKAVTAADLVGEAWSALPVTALGRTALAAVLERPGPDAAAKVRTPDDLIKSEASIHPRLPGADKPPAAAEGKAGVREPILPDISAPAGKEMKHPEAAEGIYLDNAGLVLLHPFLPRFFEGLAIAGEGQLLQPERALCLLHFLATGQTATQEYDLVLPKILCNLPLPTPVETGLELTPGEIEEADALLKAVIGHWEALRKTSPDGLRGTFLLRPGKVSLRDGDWLLQVEGKTFDILLEYLPWGISMIKLPWMASILWVEWR